MVEEIWGENLNRNLNRLCLVYMFSLRFSESKFLINLRRQFRVPKIFSRRLLRTQVFAGFAVFIFCISKMPKLHAN